MKLPFLNAACSWSSTFLGRCAALCSGLAEVVRNIKRLAQLAQQGTAALWGVVSESILVLRYPLTVPQQCPWDYLCSMPAAQQQQYRALALFFITAGPQLLLGALAAGQWVSSLALGLQPGVAQLLQLPFTAVLKRREVSSLKEGVGRLLDVLDRAAREGHLNGRCAAKDSSWAGVAGEHRHSLLGHLCMRAGCCSCSRDEEE